MLRLKKLNIKYILIYLSRIKMYDFGVDLQMWAFLFMALCRSICNITQNINNNDQKAHDEIKNP